MKNTVAIMKCEDYGYHKIKSSLTKAIELTGGLDKYFAPGERVLLKVNLVMKKAPDEAVTTHPSLVKAMAELLIAHGCQVIIGDSPGGPFNAAALKSLYRVCGMEAVSAETGAELNFNVGSAEKENPEGSLLKRLVVGDYINGVHKIVSISKLKTHGMMTYTGAVKNMFGVVPGAIKGEYHLNMPAYKDFANALIDVCLCAMPILSVMDGIIAMEGAGPSSGTPRPVEALLVSDSPFALDKAAAAMISLPFDNVPTIKGSIDRGYTAGNFSDTDFPAGKPEDFLVKDFNIPNILPDTIFGYKLGGFWLRAINGLLKSKPVFRHSPCVGCGDCARSCPAGVIKMVNKKPQVELGGCIRCFCCQELCPKKAVEIHRPLLLRGMRRL